MSGNNKMERLPCNCSDMYCYEKIPAGCIVGELEGDELISVICALEDRPRIITMTTWKIWCENLRCNPKNGKKYVPCVM